MRAALIAEGKSDRFVFDHAEPAEYIGEACVDRHDVLAGPSQPQ